MPSRGGRIAIVVSPSLTRVTARRELHHLHRGGVRGVRFNFVRHLGGTPDMDLFHPNDGPDPGTWLACGAAPRRARHRAAD